ncbi:hypothetical protein [Hasllibacter sp. MH4015]|uniref:hypothetical protein n=1 Tax=Hasllibacter sp. MH4015 TaxID=2854029 RepID=UPI001CD5F899|nr:hypothetical protein [Hasllibacter sp. MH4015]
MTFLGDAGVKSGEEIIVCTAQRAQYHTSMDGKEIDWMALSSEERQGPTKQLYVVLRALHKKIGGRFDLLLEEAQGSPLSTTADPFSNIKRGVYDKTKTQAIHEWIARNHFEFGQRKAPKLFQYRRVSEWDQFIKQYEVEGGVTAVPLGQLGIARRSPPDDGAARFRLGQPYGFQVEVPEPCYIVAYEGVREAWHLLALGEGKRSYLVKLRPGTAALPQTSDGTPIEIAEYDDPSLHTFVFVLCFGPKPLIDQNSLITYAKEYVAIVYTLEVRFIT